MLDQSNIMKHKKFLLLFLCSIGLVDSFNGFIMQELGLPGVVGQLYRMLFMFILVLIIYKHGAIQNFRSLGFLIIWLLLTLPFIHYFFHNTTGGVSFDLSNNLKLILIILMIECIRILKSLGIIDKKDVIFVLKVNFIIFPLTILIPWLLGMGYSNYSNGSGFQGFYNANNDLNIVLIVLLSFGVSELINRVVHKEKFLFYLVINILLFISLIIIGSKSSFVFSGGIILIYLFYSFLKHKVLKTIKLLFLFSTLIALIVVVLSTFFKEDLALISDRQNYFWRVQGQQGEVATFLLSDRNGFLIAATESFRTQGSLETAVSMFIGQGRYNHSVNTAEVFNTSRTQVLVEMDLFDTFFSYGVIGTFLIYLYLTQILLKGLKSKHVPIHIKVSIFIISSFSFFGGHVLYSALSGMFLGIIMSSVETSIKEPKNEIEELKFRHEPIKQ
ncbi:O-antigen ligase family protein [Neobacillus mesonae]|nr:O-antigen ligase family protein [Neobacillus mesonae]